MHVKEVGRALLSRLFSRFAFLNSFHGAGLERVSVFPGQLARFPRGCGALEQGFSFVAACVVWPFCFLRSLPHCSTQLLLLLLPLLEAYCSRRHDEKSTEIRLQTLLCGSRLREWVSLSSCPLLLGRWDSTKG